MVPTAKPQETWDIPVGPRPDLLVQSAQITASGKNPIGPDQSADLKKQGIERREENQPQRPKPKPARPEVPALGRRFRPKDVIKQRIDAQHHAKGSLQQAIP